MTALVGSGAWPGAQTVKSSWQPAVLLRDRVADARAGSVTGREDRNLAPTIIACRPLAKAGEGDGIKNGG